MAVNKLIDSATLILLRDNNDELEVLLMRRHPQLRVLGDYWVFPGGAFEDVDTADTLIATAKNAAVRETEEETSLAINAENLCVFEHWTTPEQVPKRFATWFFVATCGANQQAQADGEEMVEALWLSPKKAMAMHRSGQANMLPPTYISLLELSQYTNADEAMVAAEQKTWQKFLPKVAQHNEQVVMLYQGDAGYELCDASCLDQLHRCVLTASGWDYQRS